MKKSLRFASAALALTLAAGCAMPAFAAGKSSISKSETVYAVMNGDGSIKNTTVSEHLYSASGLSGVTDKTTLTDIQNTESDAEFTQNGEELVWNTEDTDVYYKGNTDKALPIDVKVTYALDGQEAALEDLIGKSGHLTVTVALKNNETGTVNVNGKDRTIVTPLITAVGVILGGDASNVTAEHGMVESAAKSSVAAFVTLPGVKDSLSGLLPDEVDSIEEVDPVSGVTIARFDAYKIYPANLFMTTKEATLRAIHEIEDDLHKQVQWFESEGRPFEAKRLQERVTYDMEMLRELGHCSGIENYSRYFDGRKAGSRPYCLLDFFPEDFLIVIDESHVSVPQILSLIHI